MTDQPIYETPYTAPIKAGTNQRASILRILQSVVQIAKVSPNTLAAFGISTIDVENAAGVVERNK